MEKIAIVGSGEMALHIPFILNSKIKLKLSVFMMILKVLEKMLVNTK
jgi:hypothetical protein